MKKTLALALSLVLLICCGCTKKQTETGSKLKAEKAQYVIALNPSVTSEDGTVNSIRNTAAASMQTDIKAASPTALYESEWKLAQHTEDDNWDIRKLRGLTRWVGSAKTLVSGAPYAYTLTDSPTTSLAVYDAAKMKIKGSNMPESGIILSFAGESEEAIVYTAKTDCSVDFGDTSSGNISVVTSLCGVNTDFTANKNAKANVIVRIYRNNRIYWQEVLNAEKTAVELPQFSLELKQGDSVMFTAEAADDVSDITVGNCDIPSYESVTRTVTVKKPITEKVLIENAAGIPVLDGDTFRFALIKPEESSSEINSIITEFKQKVSSKLSCEVNVMTDDGEETEYSLYIYKTKYAGSEKALSEIQAKRQRNAGDFIIRLTENNNIVLAAATEIGIENGLNFFVNSYCGSFDAKVPTGLNYVSSDFNTLKDIKLMGAPVQDYKVVVSKTASYIEALSAKQLAKDIATLTGYEISVVKDTSVSDKEILVGDTARGNYRNVSSPSKVAFSSVDNAWKIEAKGNKLFVLGSQAAGVGAAAAELPKLLSAGTTVNNGFVRKGEYDGAYSLAGGYKLAWADEFNGTKLSSTWTANPDYPVSSDNYLGGKTYLKISQTELKNGALLQKVKKIGNDLYGSNIRTTGANEMRFQYGYVEIRVKFSTVRGVGASFWTKGDITGGFLETDIYETFGNPFRLKHNLHTWGAQGSGSHQNLLGGRGDILNDAEGIDSARPYGEEYHTVGWEWADDYSAFYVDGVRTMYFDSSSPDYDCFDKTAFIILSADPTSPSYGGDNLLPDDFTESEVSYDWLRIYQKDESGSILYVKNN